MALLLKDLYEYYNDARPFPEMERDPEKRLWHCSECGDNVEKTRRSFTLTPRCRKCSSSLRKKAHPCRTDWPFLNDLTSEYRIKVEQGMLSQRDEADFECSLHGIYRRTLAAHSQSQGCPSCAIANSCKNVDQVAALKARIATNLERYGTMWYSQTDEFKHRMLTTIKEKYGVNYAFELGKGMNTSDSGPNIRFRDFLIEYGVEFDREFPLGGKYFDFKVGNTLIEINPTATHNTTFGIRGSAPKTEDYHLKKLQLAEENGFRCLHVFDWVHPRKIALMLKPTKRISGRECQLRIIDANTAETFLENYHCQGDVKGQLITLGLIYDNTLVATMSFGMPRYNHKCDYELIRLCFHPDYAIIGGSEKLFKFFIKEFEPDSIVSYCDVALFSGAVYNKLGFRHTRTSKPTAHWISRNGEHFLESSLRLVGFDNLVGKKLGLPPSSGAESNAELMLRHKFVSVFDCGQQTWIWSRP